jgi:hypothetical protein
MTLLVCLRRATKAASARSSAAKLTRLIRRLRHQAKAWSPVHNYVELRLARARQVEADVEGQRV